MKKNLIKNKSYVLLMLGRLISASGTQMQDFALSLYVLKLTGSATMYASVIAVTVIPEIILGPICGVFADWFDRRKLMILFDILSGIVTVSMAVFYKANGILPMSFIYAVVIVLSVISLIYGSAASAVIPSIVEKDELLEANSVNSAFNYVPQIVAPIVSGIVYGLFGIYYIIIINSISFFVSMLCEVFMMIPKNERENIKFNLKQFVSDFKEGLLFIKTKKIILSLTVCAFFINFALSPIFSVGMTYILKKVFNLSAGTFGAISSISSCGAIIGSVAVGAIGSKIDVSKSFGYVMAIVSFIEAALACVIFAFYNRVFTDMNSIIIIITLLYVAAVALVIVCNILLSTLFQKETPIEIIGRAGSVLSTVCVAAMPAGQMIMGSMFDHTKAFIPIIVSAIIVLITGMVFTIFQKNNKLKGNSDINIEKA